VTRIFCVFFVVPVVVSVRIVGFQLGSVVHTCEADFFGGALSLDLSTSGLKYVCWLGVTVA
jgi:hypothetical protein